MNKLYYLTIKWDSKYIPNINGICQFRGYSESAGIYYFLMVTGNKSGHLLKFKFSYFGPHGRYKLIELNQWNPEK